MGKGDSSLSFGHWLSLQLPSPYSMYSVEVKTSYSRRGRRMNIENCKFPNPGSKLKMGSATTAATAMTP